MKPYGKRTLHFMMGGVKRAREEGPESPPLALPLRDRVRRYRELFNRYMEEDFVPGLSEQVLAAREDLEAEGFDVDAIPHDEEIEADRVRLRGLLRSQSRGDRTHDGEITALLQRLHSLGEDIAPPVNHSAGPSGLRRVRFSNHPEIAFFHIEETPTRTPRQRHSTEDERMNHAREMAAAYAQARQNPRFLRGGGRFAQPHVWW